MVSRCCFAVGEFAFVWGNLRTHALGNSTVTVTGSVHGRLFICPGPGSPNPCTCTQNPNSALCFLFSSRVGPPSEYQLPNDSLLSPPTLINTFGRLSSMPSRRLSWSGQYACSIVCIVVSTHTQSVVKCGLAPPAFVVRVARRYITCTCPPH